MADTPQFTGNSKRRIIAVWHHGNEFKITEAEDYSTIDALDRLNLGAPETQLHAIRTELESWKRYSGRWSWYHIHLVWASDKRPARQVHTDWLEGEALKRRTEREYAKQRDLYPELYTHESCDHAHGICNA